MVVFGIEIEPKIMIRLIVFAVAVCVFVIAEIIDGVYVAHSWKKNKGNFADGGLMISETLVCLSWIVMFGVLVSCMV